MMESPSHLTRKFDLPKSEAETIALFWIQNCAGLERYRESFDVESKVVTEEEEDNEDEEDNRAERDESDEEEDREQITPSDKSYWNHTGKYQSEYERLSKKYVPDFGAADSPQGNLLRLVSKIYYRLYNDGDTDMSEYDWLFDESPIPSDVPENFHSSLNLDCPVDMENAVDIAIEYCLAKEQMDKKNFPERDAEYEKIYADKVAKELQWKRKLERERTVLSPIRQMAKMCKAGELRTALSAKSMKEKNITKEDIEYIVYGLKDHLSSVLYGKDCPKNASGFNKTFLYLSGKFLDFTGKNLIEEYNTWDEENMYKVYPRMRSVIGTKI